MRGIQLVIFDLDGTLINAYPAIIRSLNYVMGELGYPKQDALLIRRAVGWGDEKLLAPFVSPKDLKKALSLYRRHHKKSLIQDSQLSPGAGVLLSRLKAKGYKLAVASNRPTKFSWILIRHLKIGRYFDYVLCADKLKNRKPHPEILNKILAKFSLKPKEALYVGDMCIDIQAGRRAKVKTIAVATGSNNRQELKRVKPYRIVNKVVSLNNIL
jgi:HAD superfamily hydrolase (TIGR01509 family)